MEEIENVIAKICVEYGTQKDGLMQIGVLATGKEEGDMETGLSMVIPTVVSTYKDRFSDSKIESVLAMSISKLRKDGHTIDLERVEQEILKINEFHKQCDNTGVFDE